MIRLRPASNFSLIISFVAATILFALAFLIVYTKKSAFAPTTSRTPYALNTSNTQRSSSGQANVGLPVRLVVPSLKIDAKIEFVGVNAQGAMDVPSDVTKAGWYKYGAHPGDIGNAVIAGHLNGIHGEPGVFKDLDKLKIGDRFSVSNDTGEIMTFLVNKIKSYNQNEQPEEVFHSAGGVHVNLITCTGAWNRNIQQYAKRLVVFADKSS